MLVTSAVLHAELQDPTRPAGFSVPVSANVAKTTDQPLQLQAVFYSPEARGVMINGRRYHVGDTLRDARIKEIEVDRVVLLTPDGELELTMGMPAVKHRHGQSQAE